MPDKEGKIIQFPFSRFNRPETVAACIGNSTAPVFEERIVNGVRELVKTGDEPLFEFVQASLDETRIYNVIARYQRGDLSALSKTGGQYIDVTGMPTNLAEAQNALIRIERQFNTLPAEVKEKFGNSVNEFIYAVSDGKMDERLKDFQIVRDTVKEGEVNAE